MKAVFRILLVCLSLQVDGMGLEQKAFLRLKERLEEIVSERGYYRGHIGEEMMELSRYQNALLSYMYASESKETYTSGLKALSGYDQDIRRVTSAHLTSIFNFYTCSQPRANPHCIEVDSFLGPCKAFLNSYKSGRELTAEEREAFFLAESEAFGRDGIVEPFLLDDSAVKSLESEVLYNFVLFPDGTVMAALERPGEKQYHVYGDEVTQAFTHPNHTILSGSPHQPVISAGAFCLYQEGERRLIFLSSKSGHFQPRFDSLEHMRYWFGMHGIEECTVIPLPDVDMAQHAINHFSTIEVPVLITAPDARRLFSRALDRWRTAYHRIDMDLIYRLAVEGLDAQGYEEAFNHIREIREEANTMRCAYRLFSKDHESPEVFHLFVKRFGKLKDAIKFNIADRVRSEAFMVLSLISTYEKELESVEVTYTTEESFHDFFEGQVEGTRYLLSVEVLHMSDYHEIKKIARELATLFELLAQDDKIEGRHYFLYYAVSKALFEVNKLMGDVHSDYVGQELAGNEEAPNPYVVVHRKINQRLVNCIDRFALNPVYLELGLNEVFARKLFLRVVAKLADLHFDLHNGYTSYRGSPDYSAVQELLLQVINQDITCSEDRLLRAKVLLVDLRELAEDVSRMYRLLDRRHNVPPEFQEYCRAMSNVIEAIDDDSLSESKARFASTVLFAFLADSSWPARTDMSYSFGSDAPGGLQVALEKAIDSVSLMLKRSSMAAEEVINLHEHVAQLLNLFNAARTDYIRDQIQEHRTTYRCCYQHMAWWLEELEIDLAAFLKRGQAVILYSDRERELAAHVISKLSHQGKYEDLLKQVLMPAA